MQAQDAYKMEIIRVLESFSKVTVDDEVIIGIYFKWVYKDKSMKKKFKKID